MSSDRFQLAAEGWRIISTYDDSRQGARVLLRWLSDRLNLTSLEIRYSRTDGRYQWRERVGRFVPGASPGVRREHPFPDGVSSWIVEGGPGETPAWDELLDLLADQWLKLAERPRMRGLPGGASADGPFPGWTALSRSSRIVRSRLGSLIQSSAPLLLVGEEGTGKRHLAELIHANGPDPGAPFSGPNERDRNGTLFVAGWNRLNRKEQLILAADSRRLIASAVPGKERAEDIRRAWKETTVGGQALTVPPLRERQEDIPALAGGFLEESTAALGVKSPELMPAAAEVLRTYTWPGNVTELKSAVRRALENLGTPGGKIGVDQLPPEIRGSVLPSRDSSFPEQLVALEYEALRKELARQRGNMTRTARALGLTPRQVSWRVRKYGINPRDFKPHHRADR